MHLPRVLFSLLLILLAHVAGAQRCDTVAFHGFYWSRDHLGFAPVRVFLNPDGSSLLLGQSGGSAPSGLPEYGDANLTLISARGNPIWSKNYGLDASNDQPFASVRLQDGGLLFCGKYTKANLYGDGWVTRVSSTGSLQWSLVFAGKSCTMVSAVAMPDGGVMLAGDLLDVFNGDALGNILSESSGRILVTRLNADGVLMWARTYSLRPVNHVVDINLMTDGSVLLTGVSREVAVQSDADRDHFVMRIIAGNGDIRWAQRLDDIGYGPSALRSDALGTVQVWSSNRVQVFDDAGTNTANFLFDTSDSLLGPVHHVHRFDPVTGEHHALYDINRESVVLKFRDLSSLERARHYAYSGSLGTNLPGYDLGLYNGRTVLVSDLLTDKLPDGTVSNGLFGWPYLYQTDRQGMTPCSDSFANPIGFAQRPLQPSRPLSFREGDFRDTATLRPMTRDNTISRQFDCFTNNCCRDTLIYRDTTLCEGQSLLLQDGTQTTTPDNFSYVYKTARGCDSIIHVKLAFTLRKEISLGSDTCLTGNASVTYDLTAFDGQHLLWDNGDTSRLRTISQPGAYWIQATYACNISRDTVLMAPACDIPPYIPNTFTPNGDGLNDVFRIPDLHGQQLKVFSIHDRFGSRIFTTSDVTKGWNGTVNGARAPLGGYVYHIEYIGLDGKPHRLKGTVTIAR